MTALQQVTDNLLMEQTAPAFREVMLKALPERFFGAKVAEHIAKVEVINGRLVIHVTDAGWRKEIAAHRQRLLRDARRLEPALAGILVTD